MPRFSGKLVYIGIKGAVLALDRVSGEEVWHTPLKGSDFVNVILDGGELLATTRGEVFCLDTATGTIRWNNPLRGWGWGLATIAIPGTSSSPAAMAEYRRRQQEAQSSAAASTTTTW
jgi:outer membrane protein assembly factor BamB